MKLAQEIVTAIQKSIGQREAVLHEPCFSETNQIMFKNASIQTLSHL